MSAFQGPGTGISGTSNQFTVGYAQGSGYSNGYAQSAGNINGYAPSAGYSSYAATAQNINSMQGMNATSWAWSGQTGTPSWLWGGNADSQYAVWSPNQMYVGTAGYATYAQTTNQTPNAGMGYITNAIRSPDAGGGVRDTTWAWSGQGGTPGHWWGANDPNYNAVWQYGQMYFNAVNGTASTAGSAGTIGSAQSFPYTNAANILTGAGYAPYNIGQTIQVGISAYTIIGSNLGLWVSGSLGAIFNSRRSNTNDGNRFLVYYNSENNGSQYGAFSNGWYAVSDAREKEEITDLDTENALKFIQSLRPRKFKWRSDLIDDHQNGTSDSDLRTGFIAQEVLSAALETKDESYMHIVNNAQQYLEKGGSLDITNLDYESNTIPTLGVSQEQIVSPLVKAVQALMNDVELLKTRISILKPKFNIS